MISKDLFSKINIFLLILTFLIMIFKMEGNLQRFTSTICGICYNFYINNDGFIDEQRSTSNYI